MLRQTSPQHHLQHQELLPKMHLVLPLQPCQLLLLLLATAGWVLVAAWPFPGAWVA
jgi:hypothetical protein